MLQPFKHNVVWAFLAKKWLHQTLLYSGFSGKIGKTEYLRRYFNRLTASYKNAGHGLFDLSHKTLSNNDGKKVRFFVSDYLKARDHRVNIKLLSSNFGKSSFCSWIDIFFVCVKLRERYIRYNCKRDAPADFHLLHLEVP